MEEQTQSPYTWYTIAWIFWLAQFVALEGSAVYNDIYLKVKGVKGWKAKLRTLSTHFWHWFNVKGKSKGWTWRRLVLGGFLLWLFVHGTFGIL